MVRTEGLLLKIVNVVTYFLFLGSNIWSAASPQRFYSNGRDTYVHPDPWVWYIWSLIHVLLLGTIIYQFTDKGHETVVKGINWRFPLFAVLIAIWASTYSSGHYIVAFIFSLLVSSASTHIYYRVKRYHDSGHIADELFVHVPFSLIQGWSTVLVVISVFAAFGLTRDHRPGIWTKVLAFLVFLFLAATSWGYAFYSKEGDLLAAAAISWSLLGIYTHQRHPAFIRYSALAFFIVSLFAVLKGAYGLLAKRRKFQGVVADEERQPILGGSS